MKNKNLVKFVDASRKKSRRKTMNHIILVLDQSGSMGSIRDDAVKAFSEQVANIHSEAAKSKQEVNVYTITFSDNVNAPQEDFNIQSYRPDGNTNLWGAIEDAINFSQAKRKLDDTALVVIVTDGNHNWGPLKEDHIRTVIGKAMSEPNFSIIANVPPHKKERLISIGVPAANVREWEATARGVEELTSGFTRGYTSYFNSLSLGGSTQVSASALVADMDTIVPSDVNQMIDLSTKFKRWRVPNAEDRQISVFVANQGFAYSVGRAFYELTKSEKISANKQLLILDKKTGALYGGEQARRKLGLPVGQDIRLKPGTSGEFTLFVESTSYNRKLVGNTTLLYRV